METLINEILTASGSMPDPTAHRRYLATLSEAELHARLNTLRDTREIKASSARWWSKKRPLEAILAADDRPLPQENPT